MLKTRIISGLIMALIVIAAVLFFNTFEFALVTAILMGLAAWEWAGLVQMVTPRARGYYVLLTLIVIGISSAVLSIALLIAAAFLLLWLCEEVYRYAKNKPVGLLNRPFYGKVLGVLLFTFCWTGFNTLYDLQQGHVWVLYAMALVCVVDTAGYFVGKRWGRRILCARVSPNKTWEGLWAGLVASIIVALIAAVILHLSAMGSIYLLLGSLVGAVFALYGDLIESMMKRHAGIKDSGQLIPGHGGILDRIDGMLGAIPILALLALILSL
jgi:phosphatidate cytidylyltransferase